MDYTLKEDLFEKIIFYVKLLFVPFAANNFRPKFLRNHILLYVVICLLIVKIISIVVFINFPKNIFFADITKNDLISLINQKRLSLSVLPLIESQKLDQAALLKAQDMLAKDYFSHQSPSGVTPWYWFSKAGYNYKYAGENLAIGFLNSEDVYRAWINSASHKENIINPNYKEVGTAVLTGEFKGNDVTVIVQLFGNPKIANIQTIQNKIIEEKLKTKKQPMIVNQTIVQGKVLSESIKAPLEEGNISYYKFLNFTFYNSDKIFEYIIYFLLILTVISLLINVSVGINMQDKYLILRSIVIIFILSITALLNKEIINQIIPYKIII